MVDTEVVLEALGEANRRRLLELLHRRDESTVSELVDASGLRQPQVSKHLKVLAGASLVSVRADGRYRRYRLDGRGLRAAHDWFASFEASGSAASTPWTSSSRADRRDGARHPAVIGRYS